MISRNKRLFGLLATIPLLLMLPLVAMQYTDAVSWQWPDFVIMAVIMIVAVILIETIMRVVHQTFKRQLLIFLTVMFFLLLWVELAVGLLSDI